MVGIVIVSHSAKLAEATCEMAQAMARNIKIIPAGGMDNGLFGTSQKKIAKAIDEAYSDDGVVVICDLGSSVNATRELLETKAYKNKLILLADCPIVEGAIAAGVSASCAMPIEEVLKQAEISKNTINLM